jgi:hypothetical protein
MSISNDVGSPRWPGSLEAEEAEALHTIARVMRGHASPTIDTNYVRRQVGAALDAVAVELSNGRAVPIGVRRATIGLADALRLALDPNGISEP